MVCGIANRRNRAAAAALFFRPVRPVDRSRWRRFAPAAVVSMQLKKDPIAEEWLARDAERWLEPVGELRWK